MRLADRRIGLLFAVFLALLSFAVLRATWLGTVKADGLKERAATQQKEDIVVHARRGTISDRRGVELAVSEDATTVFAYPFLIKDPAAVAAKLAPLLGVPEDDLLPKLDSKKGYILLQHAVDATTGAKIAKLRIEGIGTESEPKRTYPQGALASQVLGMVGTENKGLAGLEYSQDKTLAGHDGKRTVVRDAMGQTVNLVDTEQSSPGHDLRLTLDAAIQERVEAVLAQVGATYAPRGATAVVMDPRTGAVLALANWPRVDANDVGEAPAYATQNRAIQSIYEPGSTFKAITVSGALQEGLITPNTAFDLPSTLQVADRTIEESHARGPVTLTTAQILAQSSNVGAVTIGLKLGATRFDRWVRRFGFGQPTGIELPGEQQGIVLRPKDYSGSSMGNMPIGQGIAVTPMQMAAAYTAVANKGIMHEPYLIEGHRRPGTRVIGRKTSEDVSSMLEGVLAAGGTAQEASVPGYTIAGKTGTAEKADKNGYSKTKFVASFIGFAPAKDPRLLVSVMVDEPKGDIYGGTVAAPAFERIMEFALPYLKIPPR